MAMNLEPNTQKFLDALAPADGPPIHTLTPDGARKVLSQAQAGPVKASAVDIEDRTVPVGPEGSTRIRIIRPRGVTERLPLVMYFHNAYLPDEAKRKDPTVSPLRASVEQLTGLPPALITITGENDVLRDEGDAYAAKLAQAGVHVSAVRSLGTIHDFVMLNGLSDTPAARGAISQATEDLRKVFAK